MLRRAGAPRRTSRRGARVCAPVDRRVRTSGSRSDRRQRRRLRVVDEGYGELLADDPAWSARAHAFSARVRDVSEVLVELGEPRAPRHPAARARVVYHDACHLAHAQGVRAQPRDLLRAIPGLEFLSPAEPEVCCGSAGIYNLVQPSGRRARRAKGRAHRGAAARFGRDRQPRAALIQIAATAGQAASMAGRAPDRAHRRLDSRTPIPRLRVVVDSVARVKSRQISS